MRKPFYKRKLFIGLVAFFILGGIGALFDDEKDIPTNESSVSEQKAKVDDELEEVKAKQELKDSQKSESRPEVPAEYKAALRSAKNYSDLMSMSKQGIYDQLTSEYGEQFPPDAAQYAIDNLNADYNKNALEKAKIYRDTMDMSDSAIRDQLISPYGEQFTPEEADYAIANLPQ